MSSLEAFRFDIEAFLERTGMAASAFGNEAIGDPNFVADLRGGRSVGLRLADRVRDFMGKHESAIQGDPKPKVEPASP